MKKDLYNLKLGRGGGGIGIDIGIGIDDGIGLGLVDDITPEGYQFYNLQIDRISYFLQCSNGDDLESVNSVDLRAYNV